MQSVAEIVDNFSKNGSCGDFLVHESVQRLKKQSTHPPQQLRFKVGDSVSIVVSSFSFEDGVVTEVRPRESIFYTVELTSLTVRVSHGCSFISCISDSNDVIRPSCFDTAAEEVVVSRVRAKIITNGFAERVDDSLSAVPLMFFCASLGFLSKVFTTWL